MKGFFITATDTGVGKTWFTSHLCRHLRRAGMNAGVWKPVQSGCTPGSPDADSAVLKRISGVDDDEASICSFSFRAPLAPMVAARLEGRRVDCDMLMASSELLFQKYDIMLVEGAGGFAVPLGPNELISDLAVRLNFPVIIVARPGLGTVNHCLLTVEAVRNCNLPLAGIVLNGYDEQPDRLSDWEELTQGAIVSDSSRSNPLLIEHFAGVPVVGTIPTTHDDVALEDYVNVKRILNALK
jgi:dethiobiotin synthetase